MKKLLAVIMILSLCLPFVACKTPTPEGEQGAAATTYIGIEINPSIEITADENGVVCTVYGANEDGAVLLYGEEEAIIGKSYEEAVAYITTLAHELGYLKDGQEVKTTVSSDDENTDEQIREKLHTAIEGAATKLGVTVTTVETVAREILRGLEELKAQYPDNAKIQALTPGKYKMVLSASENGEITIEAAVELDNEALIQKINDVHAKVASAATTAYKHARAKAEMAYELALGVLLDGVYTGIYVDRATTDPVKAVNTFHYGAVYQAYKTSARTLCAIEDILEVAAEVQSYEVSSDIVNAIADELGVEDVSVFADEDGAITLASVIKATDNILDQNDFSDEIEDKVEDMIEEAETAAHLYTLSMAQYKTDLAALKLQIETSVANIKLASTPYQMFMTSDAKAKYEECLAYLEETVEKIHLLTEGALSAEEFDAMVDEAEERAEAMLEVIENDLSEEEKAKVEEKKAEIQGKMEELHKEFTDRLDAAEKQAREELARRHEERKNQSK
ncbi:MAG: hypothetical protein IKC72_01220 [Clostridia bacterium]|nr:hypothetical protein [Clostridia bacterium]